MEAWTLHMARSSHKCLWIHVESGDIQHHPLAGWADSMSLDLTNDWGLQQPMAIALVRNNQYLQTAMNGKNLHQFRPYSLTTEKQGYNSSEWSWELSKPARFIPLWFHLNMCGLQNMGGQFITSKM